MLDLGYKFNVLYRLYEGRSYSELLPIVTDGSLRDCPASLHILGLMYMYGDGVVEDRKLAQTLLKKAESIDPKYEWHDLEEEERLTEDRRTSIEDGKDCGLANWYYDQILRPCNEYTKWELRRALLPEASHQSIRVILDYLISGDVGIFEGQVGELRRSKSKLAPYILGLLHLDGRAAVFPDTSAALRSIEHAAADKFDALGLPQATLFLIDAYATGILVEKNIILAMEHAERLEDRVDELVDAEKEIWVRANLQLADNFAGQHLFDKDFSNALTCLARLVPGNDDARVMIDELYSEHVNDPFNQINEDLHLTFAMAGCPSAILKVGLRTFIGEGYEPSETLGLQLIRLAALLGDVAASTWEERLVKTLDFGNSHLYRSEPIPLWFHKYIDVEAFPYL